MIENLDYCSCKINNRVVCQGVNLHSLFWHWLLSAKHTQDTIEFHCCTPDSSHKCARGLCFHRVQKAPRETYDRVKSSIFKYFITFQFNFQYNISRRIRRDNFFVRISLTETPTNPPFLKSRDKKTWASLNRVKCLISLADTCRSRQEPLIFAVEALFRIINSNDKRQTTVEVENFLPFSNIMSPLW